jgi:hypothetical protein
MLLYYNGAMFNGEMKSAKLIVTSVTCYCNTKIIFIIKLTPSLLWTLGLLYKLMAKYNGLAYETLQNCYKKYIYGCFVYYIFSVFFWFYFVSLYVWLYVVCFCLIVYILYADCYVMYYCCYTHVFLLLCMFRSRYSVSLCWSVYYLCVNMYCTTANGCQPNCS